VKSKDDIFKQIINDLKKTGFVSEMHAMKGFLLRNWHTSGGRYYFDLDENKTCEIDLSAYNALIDKNNAGTVTVRTFFNIIAEVKKTDNPWVVFKNNPQQKWMLAEGWNGIVHCDGLPGSRKNLTEILLNSSLGVELGWLGYGIHESFKEPNQFSSWYKALVKVAKAAEDVLKANSSGEHEYPYFYFVKPVIIVDGILMSAVIADDASIKLEKINAAVMSFGYSTTNYKRNYYMVDVVTLEYLPDYIKFCEERHRKIFDELKVCYAAKGTVIGEGGEVATRRGQATTEGQGAS